MRIKTYKSNIDIFFDDDRNSITLDGDNYFNLDRLPTEDEERESLSEKYELTQDENDEIISTLHTCEWITDSKAVLMARLFNVPTPYMNQALFDSLNALRKFFIKHEEQIQGFDIFDIHFDTDEWTMDIGGGEHSLDMMIDVMETQNYSYFEDVKAHHGSAEIGFEAADGDWITLYRLSFD